MTWFHKHVAPSLRKPITIGDLCVWEVVISLWKAFA